MKVLKFDFYSDPGHGWLRVKRHLVMDLGIGQRITRFSFERGQWVYLEEDCDAGVFLEALRARPGDYAFSVREHCSRQRESKIRSYARYRFDLIDAAYVDVITRKVTA